MGHQDIVSNARGTSAETFIVTQEGDDKFFVSSDACEDQSTANSVEVLYGVLDYTERDLHLKSDGGRHRLMISDNPGIPNLFAMSQIRAKGVGSRGYAELTRSSLENLADGLGNIFFSTATDTGNWRRKCIQLSHRVKKTLRGMKGGHPTLKAICNSTQ